MAAERVRHLAEVAVPGAVVGALGGLVAGLLALLVGQPLGWAMTTGLMLAAPLGLFGGALGLLHGTGRWRTGAFAPVALFWLVGFPLARLVGEVGTGLVLGAGFRLPPDVLGFLAYQGIVSCGWSLGFLWLHERIAPHWLARVREHNPVARQWFERYLAHARVLQEAARRRRAARAGGR